MLIFGQSFFLFLVSASKVSTGCYFNAADKGIYGVFQHYLNLCAKITLNILFILFVCIKSMFIYDLVVEERGNLFCVTKAWLGKGNKVMKTLILQVMFIN